MVGGRDEIWDWVVTEVGGKRVGERDRPVGEIGGKFKGWVGTGFWGNKGGRMGRFKVCLVEVGGRRGGCKEPVKPFELIRGLSKGRSRMRGDLGGRGGEAEVGGAGGRPGG